MLIKNSILFLKRLKSDEKVSYKGGGGYIFWRKSPGFIQG